MLKLSPRRTLIRQRHIRVGKQICTRPSCAEGLCTFHLSQTRRHPIIPGPIGQPVPYPEPRAPSALRSLEPGEKHIDFALTSPFGGGRPGRPQFVSSSRTHRRHGGQRTHDPEQDRRNGITLDTLGLLLAASKSNMRKKVLESWSHHVSLLL